MKHRDQRILIYCSIWFCLFVEARADWRVVTHFSASLAVEKSFYIYLPDSGQNEQKYPALYLLHGVGGNYTNWMQVSHIREQARNYQMIIVLPDGGEYGWYIDSPFDSSSRYESYIVADLIPYVESRFPARPGRESRAISGLSMGGHGAVSLALKHPELIGCASSLSGILDLTIHPTMWSSWQLDRILGSFEQYPGNWRPHNSYDLVLQIGLKPNLFFDCGEQDVFALADNRRFNRRLDSLNIPHFYKENPGGHQWVYWDSHLQEHLQFHDAFFRTTRVATRALMASQHTLSCYPNPCNASTTISFATDSDGEVLIEIYNSIGNRVCTLLDQWKPAGTWRVAWDATAAHRPVSSGLYFVRCKIDRHVKMIGLTVVR
jgi:S-formylglutathione hydrolase FrmB